MVQRYYTSLKLDSSFKRRVTSLGEGRLKSSLALVEYVGKFPGLAPHGNSRGTNEYIRTPDYVLDEIPHRVAIDKPKQIYDALKVTYDEVTGPSSIQQVKDR